MTQFGQSSSPTLEQCIGALKLIDVMLATAEGDNIPRGEAPKHHVRLLARQILGWTEQELARLAAESTVLIPGYSYMFTFEPEESERDCPCVGTADQEDCPHE